LEVVEHDLRALGGEAQRDRLADPTRCAGDDRHFILEAHV
jgi:hypothetical protein